MRKRTTWLDLLQQEISRKMQEDGRTLRHGERLWCWKMQLVPGETSESYTLNWYCTLFQYSITYLHLVYLFELSFYFKLSTILLYDFACLCKVKRRFLLLCFLVFLFLLFSFFFNYTHYFQFIAFVSVSFCQRDRSISHLPFIPFDC